MKDGAKSRVITISSFPQDSAYTRALKSETSLSPPIPVGGGGVDTNDWCIRKHCSAFMYSIHYQCQWHCHTPKHLVKTVCQLCFVVTVVSYSTLEILLV